MGDNRKTSQRLAFSIVTRAPLSRSPVPAANQRPQAFGWDHRARADLSGFNPAFADQLIELGSANADRAAGLGDGVCELGAIELLHCSVSARTRA